MTNTATINQAVNCLVSSTDNGIALNGSLVYHTASTALSQGCDLLKPKSVDTLAIDLSKVDRIDSAGISVLLAWKRLSDENKKRFQISGAQDQAISLISTNKLENILQVID